MLDHEIFELLVAALSVIVFDHEFVLGQFSLNWLPKQAVRALPRTAVLEHLNAVSIEKQYFFALLLSYRILLLALSFGDEVMHTVGAPLYLVGFQVAKVHCLFRCVFVMFFLCTFLL